jgi:uncharacterized protein (DUF1786 family)
VEQAISSGHTPLFWGTNMGGFSLKPYIAQLKQHGKKIVATGEAAKTFNDYPDELAEQGVTIISEDESEKLMSQDECFPIKTGDIDLDAILAGFSNWGITLDLSGIAVAVQDHGQAPPNMSDRRFRFQNYRKKLEAGDRLLDWAYMRTDIPRHLTRMQAVSDSLPDNLPLLLMDTGMAAVLGSLEDEAVAAAKHKLIVNIGNGHTLGVYLQKRQIAGLWEHHTSRLDAPHINQLLKELITGKLDNEKVFASGGHGAYINTKVYQQAKPELTCLTGPNRAIMNGDHYQASPYGNMMLTGAYGLLRAYRIKNNLR